MITVLGASGFIGSSLVNKLKSGNISYYAPKRDETLASKELGNIVYCIGLTADFRERPMDTVKAHICKLVNLLENSSFESLLYLSSTRVYNGSSTGEETADLKVNPADFSDIYNISKLMGEAICFAIPNEKIRIVRLSNVIGNNFNSDNFLFSLIKNAVDNKEINLRVAPNSSKDYIAIDDVISLLQLIALNGKRRIYNISSGQSVSNMQLAEEIMKHTNCKVNFSDAESGLSFPMIPNDRIREEFSFSPKNIIPEIKILIEKYRHARHDSN